MVYSMISSSRTNDNDSKEHLENSKIMFSLSKPLLFLIAVYTRMLMNTLLWCKM